MDTVDMDYNYNSEGLIVVQKVNQLESKDRTPEDLKMMYGSAGSPINIKQFSQMIRGSNRVQQPGEFVTTRLQQRANHIQ